MPHSSDPSSRAPNVALDAAGERDCLAVEALARVERESETIGISTLPRAGQRALDDDSHEAVVRWGKRLGRSLGVAVALYLLWKVAGVWFLGQGSMP